MHTRRFRLELGLCAGGFGAVTDRGEPRERRRPKGRMVPAKRKLDGAKVSSEPMTAPRVGSARGAGTSACGSSGGPPDPEPSARYHVKRISRVLLTWLGA